MLMFVMVRIVFPVFVTVTAFDALEVPTFWRPKFKLLGTRLTTVPVPVRLTLCGLLIASSVKTTAAILFPVAVGLKVTATVQVAPAAKLLSQELLEITKSLPFAPVTLMLVIVKDSLPVLVNFTFFGVLLIPTN